MNLPLHIKNNKKIFFIEIALSKSHVIHYFEIKKYRANILALIIVSYKCCYKYCFVILQPAQTLTTLSLDHYHHYSFLPNLPQIIHNRFSNEKIYRFINSVVVVVIVSWRYGRHSHLVCTRSM